MNLVNKKDLLNRYINFYNPNKYELNYEKGIN